ncbi:MAG: hypothetical protein ACQGVC_03820 [Myxococcota bacterium]
MKVGVLATMMALLMVAGFSLSAQAGPAPDMDSDGTIDAQDICSADATSPSPNACDTDMDGYGNACDADFNNDGTVGGPDFGPFVAAFGTTGGPCFNAADLNGDGTVGGPDFGPFVNQFGGPPGPSGLGCAGTITCP